MKKTIRLPEDVCNDIERKMYEYNVAKDNVAFLISSNRDDVSILDSAVFKRYLQDEIEKSQIYEEAKAAMIKEFVPAETAQFKWTLNFREQLLELNEIE